MSVVLSAVARRYRLSLKKIVGGLFLQLFLLDLLYHDLLALLCLAEL